MWGIYIGLILAGLFLKDSKPYAALVTLFFGILAWNNTDAADYTLIYLNPYNFPGLYGTDTEPGWALLSSAARLCGLSYNGFACLVAMASVYLLYRFAKGSGVNSSYFLSLFLIYPGLMSLVQFRQFLASAIVAAGILLLKREGRLKYLWFCAAVLLAYTVHRSALLMLALLLLPLAYRAGSRARVVLVIAALACAVFVTVNAEAFSTFFFGEYKTAAYLQKTDSMAGAASALGGLRNVAYLIGFAALAVYLASLGAATPAARNRSGGGAAIYGSL